jgi:hypothetical protein
VRAPEHLTHFVLDQNFPLTALRLDWPLSLRLTPLPAIEPDLVKDHEDWEILYRLNQRGDVHGFVSNDSGMLNLPREMVVLQSTGLTLVITDGVGHNPIRATGLLMVHLDEIAKRITGRPQLFMIKPASMTPTNLAKLTNGLAERARITPPDLLRREREAVRQHFGAGA